MSQQYKPAAGAIALHRKPLGRRILNNWQLYLLLLIPVVLTIIYKYVPMYGIQIAFRDFKASRGYTGSEWVGLYWFERFFSSPTCVRMIKNYRPHQSVQSAVEFPPSPSSCPSSSISSASGGISGWCRRFCMPPNFISIMVVCGMLRIFLSPSGGFINLIFGTSIDFLTESSAFRTIYIASGIWQDAGWGCIIYLATLANVDPGLYEAAKIDGASVFQRIKNIDLPELLPMAILNLIMAAGGLMNVGFEKVWLLQTDLNKATSDVIAVYVYQQGIENAKYSYSTAVGLFNTAVNIILLLIVNKIASKASDVEFV